MPKSSLSAVSQMTPAPIFQVGFKVFLFLLPTSWSIKRYLLPQNQNSLSLLKIFQTFLHGLEAESPLIITRFRKWDAGVWMVFPTAYAFHFPEQAVKSRKTMGG